MTRPSSIGITVGADELIFDVFPILQGEHLFILIYIAVKSSKISSYVFECPFYWKE